MAPAWIAGALGAGLYVAGAVYDYTLRVGAEEPNGQRLTALNTVRMAGAATWFVVVAVQVRAWTEGSAVALAAATASALLLTAAKYGLLRWARRRYGAWERPLRWMFHGPLAIFGPVAAAYEAGARALGASTTVRKPEHRKYDPEPVILQNLEREARESDAVTGEVLRNLAEFQNLRARDCLVPRTEIVALPITASVSEFRRTFQETGLSRIVVYGRHLDDVKGFVHVLGLFQRPKEISEIVQPAFFVAETTGAPTLLDEFNRKHKSAAIVVDEYGGVAGLVTVEDVIEAVIGDVDDEYDDETETEAQIVGPDEYLFAARLEVERLNAEYGLELPVGEEYETLGGMIMHLTERVPQTHEQLTVGPYLLTVVKGNFHKIETVRVQKIE
jgi:CBS domain containing-hemolysin-like protein